MTIDEGELREGKGGGGVVNFLRLRMPLRRHYRRLRFLGGCYSGKGEIGLWMGLLELELMEQMWWRQQLAYVSICELFRGT